MDAKNFEVGQVWVTRDGEAETIINTDIGDHDYPIAARNSAGIEKCFTRTGNYFVSGTEYECDLIELKTSKPQEFPDFVLTNFRQQAEWHDVQATATREAISRARTRLEDDERDLASHVVRAAYYRGLIQLDAVIDDEFLT